MISFDVYATQFELFPDSGEAFISLLPLVNSIPRVEFTLSVADPNMNQGQMASNFDQQLELGFIAAGSRPYELELPPGVPQELDFAFEFQGKTVAVEIEKANREKILRDILKCHMYLHAGADLTVVVLPRNYAHKHGLWNLFHFGVQRFCECQRYGFGTPEKLSRIALLGYTQHERTNDLPLSTISRQRMRIEATQLPTDDLP